MTADVSQLKRMAAERAVEWVESGMIVGLGHGSTALEAVRALAERLKSGALKDIVGIPCSVEIGRAAKELGISLGTLEDYPVVDMTIDGADEVDRDLNLIKGGGGALLREKVVAQSSKREVIIVDDSKISQRLGEKWAVPVEVLPFGVRPQREYLESLGSKAVVRLSKDGTLFHTDQGNLIIDCDFGVIEDPVTLAERIKARTGIVEHGLFVGMATEVVVASAKGVTVLSRQG